MKILLLNPTVISGEPILRSERCQGKLLVGLWPPTGLASVAAVLREHGFDSIRIYDAVAEHVSFDRMIEAVVEHAPDFILIQNITPTIADDKHAAALIRAGLPRVAIAFYGTHATARPEDILDASVPFCVRNEPEWTVLELLRYIERGGAGDGALAMIRGLSFWADGKTVSNPQREALSDLDALPFPARDLLENDRYVIPTTREPFTIIRTSSGCPCTCIYCAAPGYSGRKWRTRSAASIVAEMRECVKTYRIDNFFFSSDTFNISEGFVGEICDEIRASGMRVSWMCNSRVDNFSLGLALKMKQAGCWLIAFGIESGSQKVLDAARKKATVEQGREAIRNCRTAGIVSLAYFMFGLPAEDSATIAQTMAFARDADPDYAHFYTATPLPGTEFFTMAEQEGYLVTRDWKRYFHGMSDVVEYPWLGAREITDTAKAAFRAFYFRPGRILKEIKRVNSWATLKGTLQTFGTMMRTWVARK